MNNHRLILPALILAAGLAVLGLCIKAGFDTFADRDRVVTVRGLAEKEVEANKVTWPLVYKLVGNDLPGLYDQINANNDAVTRYLTSNGLSRDEISIGAPDISDRQADRYDNTPVAYRYNVTSVIVVTSSKIDLVRRLINRRGELLKQGIAIVSDDYQYQTQFEYTLLNDIKPEMIAEATRNAREAGDRFAADSHSKLGKIKTASQGQFSIEDRDPYTPYLKKVRVVSTITYCLQD